MEHDSISQKANIGKKNFVRYHGEKDFLDCYEMFETVGQGKRETDLRGVWKSGTSETQENKRNKSCEVYSSERAIRLLPN